VIKLRNRLIPRSVIGSLVLSLFFAGSLIVGTASPAAAESCFGSWRDHAHSHGVARERIYYSFCDSGRSVWSVDLTDTLCGDNRAAQVYWWLYDSIGLVTSGNGTNTDGCNSTKRFTIGSYFHDIQRLQTGLRACNAGWPPCSSIEYFNDYF
jgi:hypothetical protein